MAVAVLEEEVDAPQPGGSGAVHLKGGWRGRAIGALWFTYLALALLAVAVGTFSTARTQVALRTAFLGVGLTPPSSLSEGATISASRGESGAPAIAPGSVPLAVDGTRLSGVRSENALLGFAGRLRGPDGTRVRLTIRSPNGQLRDVRLARSSARVHAYYTGSGLSPSSELGIQLAIGVIANLLLIAAAVLLFRRAAGRWVAVLLSFSSLAWAAVVFSSAEAYWVLGVPWIIPVLHALAGPMLPLALLAFPDGRFAPRWTRWAAYGLIPYGLGHFLPFLGLPFPVQAHVLGFVLFMALGIAAMIVRYRRLPGAERQQVRWALFGFSISVFCELFNLTALYAPDFLSGSTELIWSGILGSVFFALVIGAWTGGLIVSVLRYRLFDADAVIARSVSFGALALALMAVFAGTERVIELLGEEYLGQSIGVLAGGIGAAFAAAMIVPLHHRLSHWAEHRFQKQLIALKHGLPLLVGDMRETAPVKRIAAATLDSVVHGVRASRAAVLFKETLLDARAIEPLEVEQWRARWRPASRGGFDIDRADALFPLRVPLAADGHGRIGWLLLGPRPDGSFYGKDERETLAQIADPVARALEIAAAREKREAEEAQRWRAQESLNAEIRSVNGELVRILGSLDAKLGQLFPPAAEAAE